MAKCECTSQCGDDPAVIARSRMGCLEFRARSRSPAAGLHVELLRVEVQALVGLLDRMESEVPEEERASEAEWDAIKAHAKLVLVETE